MKSLFVMIVGGLVSGSVLADFDSDFAQFDRDFARLNQVAMVKKVNKRPAVRAVDVEPEYVDTQKSELIQHEVDPTSPDRLGHQIEDPVMRDKVISLYNKPEIKVYSYVLQAE